MLGDCMKLEGLVIIYDSNCLESGQTYFAECELSANGPNGQGRGKRRVQFNTESNLGVTATISPNSGTEFTDFTIDITVTHDYGSSCYLAYIDPFTYESVPFGPSVNIGANGSRKMKNRKLRTLSFADGVSLLYTVYCESQVTNDESDAILDVAMATYAGDDLATHQQAQLSSFETTMNATTFTPGSSASSSQAADAIGNVISASSGFASATEAIADQIIDFLGEALANLDFEKDDQAAALMIDAIIGVAEVFSNGIKADAANNMLDALNTMFVGPASTRMLQAGTDSDSIKKIKPTDEETVRQLKEHECSNLAQAISDFVGGVEASVGMAKNDKEKLIRKCLPIFDKLTKACLHNLNEGKTFEIAGESVFFHVLRQSKASADYSNDISYEFDCPCSTGYSFTAAASSHKAKAGTASQTGSTATSTTSTTSSDPNKCFVNIPAFSKVDADLSKCKSVGVTIVATKNMCPGQGSANESDTTAAVDDFSAVDSTVTETSDYKGADFEGADGVLNIGDYSSLKCTGPSLEVSYYCLQGKRANGKGKRLTKRIKVKKFKENGAVSYKIGCSANQNSSTTDAELVPTFLDESTGQNNVVGCTVDNSTGNQKCFHTTSFGYASTVKSSGSTGKKDFGARIFENYIFYVMLLIDIYFIITLVFHFLTKKNNKEEIAVVDESKAMEEFQMKNGIQKIEVASSMNAGEMRNGLADGSSDNKSNDGNVTELHKAGFCTKLATGFMLKYRLLAPFTTVHPGLSRLSRGIIN